MRNAALSRFESFARDFVRAYWQTVKSGNFSMPPNEPVEETVDELLAAVSHETEIDTSSTHSGRVFKVRMTNTQGDWWIFSFREISGTWNLVACSARSGEDGKPHDLLDTVYSQYFGPFLRHVTEAANAQNRI